MRDLESRLSYLEESLANIPSRRCVSGMGGGSAVVLLKITGLHSDSPASGVRMYLGDVYGDGEAATATQEDVTVAIPGIADDVELPSSGAWADVPHCLGLPITETWVGATTTHTNDTVYYALGMLLII